MRVVILTSSLYGTAAHHLPLIVQSDSCTVAMVIRSQQLITDKKKYYSRKLIKIIKIGLFGALNGLRMRKWFNEDTDKYLQSGRVDEICKQYNIPFYTVPAVNCPETVRLFEKAKADLGLSLGNGYISEKIFSIPTHGMVNIHHEMLPAYQNAQSVIWQIYNGSTKTGYTIHKIDKKIDAGAIIYQEEIPISFRTTLADTVAYTYSLLLESSAKGLVEVLKNFDKMFAEAKLQEAATPYTTPSIWQYFKIYYEYRKMKRSLVAIDLSYKRKQ